MNVWNVSFLSPDPFCFISYTVRAITFHGAYLESVKLFADSAILPLDVYKVSIVKVKR